MMIRRVLGVMYVCERSANLCIYIIYIYHQTLPLNSLVYIFVMAMCVCVCLTRRSLYYWETKLTIVPIKSTNPCRVLGVTVEPFKFESKIQTGEGALVHEDSKPRHNCE